MLRVGIDITPLVGPPTGIHQHTRHLTDALFARDDVSVSGWLLSARGNKPAFAGPVRRSPVPASLAARLWARAGWPGRRSLAGDVDVVHGTNFLGPPASTTVLTIQDLTPLRTPDLVSPGVAAKAPAIRAAMGAGAWVHTSSQLVADELAAEGHTDRIRVVHHGVRPPAATPDGAGRRLAGRDRYVLVLGTTERRKRVPLVVEAIRDMPADVALVIAGPAGDDEHAVDAAIRSEGVGDRVRRLRDVDDAGRDALVNDATAVVLAASYEGFGFTPLEALSVGTPVVATAVGALPELVGDHLDLLDPATPALGPSLLATCEDPSVPDALSERVRALTWTAHADAMVELYRLAAGS